jgi:hypothetical protein
MRHLVVRLLASSRWLHGVRRQIVERCRREHQYPHLDIFFARSATRCLRL